MFSSAFREFETDPFFDFGNSPFRLQQQHPMLEDRGTSDYRSHQRRNQSRSGAAEPVDPRYEGALVPAARSSRPGEDATRQVRRQPEQDVDKAADDRRRQLERYDGSRQRQIAERRGADGFDDELAMAPYPSMLGGFASFERQFSQMMNGMQRMMADMGDRMRQMEEATSRDDFDGHMYSHASVYSRRYDGKEGGGEPHVYQAMSETRAGPGGVRETKRAVRDTRAQEERAAHGRHIGAKGHVVERRRNMGTGDQQEDHKYAGIGEADVDSFDREWHSRATALMADEDAAARRRRHALAERPGRRADGEAAADQQTRRARAIAAHGGSGGDRDERRGGKL